jgi:rod shape-determining protein MreD
VTPTVFARLRISALLLLALLLQTTVVPDLRISGVCPDIMLLLAVCAGLAGGPERGATVGFSAGLLVDLFLPTTPLGLSALAYCLVGFSVGALRGSLLREGWLLAPAVALIASAAGVLVFVAAGVTVGQSQLTGPGPVTLAKTAVIVGVMNAVLAIPVSRIVTWASNSSQGGGSSLATGRPPTRSRRSGRTALGR